MAKVLLLGGTAEARALAERLVPTHDVITSLAGRTRNPRAVPGTVRTGGFGGPAGLAVYLKEQGIDALIDASHPFAAQMSAHARQACDATNTPRLTLVRAPWTIPSTVTRVTSLQAAADALVGTAQRVFLTVGRDSLAAFSSVENVWFLVRLLEQPDTPLALADYHVVTARPPFDEATERALLTDHAIDCLIAKDAGGAATEAKIQAALKENIRVILIDRPPVEPGATASTADDVVAWLTRLPSA